MRSPLLVLAGLALALAAPGTAAAAQIRALFVGVDHYRYSSARVPGAEFADLHGAVGDVGRIKAALRTAYGLDLDRPAAGCRSANAVSTTLTDDCATRADILAALDERIGASAAGDTVLFYFAGHGSQIVDDQVFDQASCCYDTLLPTDARQPGAAAAADIQDRELREVIDRASRKGVNVVTIFDSCNSGTATRDPANMGEARSAPPLKVRGAAHPKIDRYAASGAGYRVHLAATADGETASEVDPKKLDPNSGAAETRAGVFTYVLAKTLIALPNAPFEDIAAEVRQTMDEMGRTTQHPQAEGRLRASLGRADQAALLAEAVPEGDHVSLNGGRITGVTEGSEFAVFATTAAALDPAAKPLARGRVTRVDATRAELALDAPLPAPAPKRLMARETAHAFGAQRLLVRIDAPAGVREEIAALVKTMPFVTVGEPAQFAVVARGGEGALTTADGAAVIEPLTVPGDALYADALRGALQRVLRAQSLLALRSDPTTAGTTFCIAGGEHDVYDCPRETRMKVNERLQLTVRNTSGAPRYVYVVGVDERYHVEALVPPNGGKDPPINEKPVQRPIWMDAPGTYRFVTIATEEPIDVRLLEQSATRDPAACRNALERLLCAANTGTRDAATPRVGAWTALVTSAVVQ